jgi:hypothetical protein
VDSLLWDEPAVGGEGVLSMRTGALRLLLLALLSAGVIGMHTVGHCGGISPVAAVRPGPDSEPTPTTPAC